MIKGKKISVIGGCGTGKTILVDNLGIDLNLPILHIDGVHYLKNWEIREKEERDNIILEKVSQNEWVIDGTYTSTLKERIQKSELIIYLDYSRLAQCKGIMQRYLKKLGKEKSEIPGCKEQMSWEFLKWAWNWRKNKRNHILNLLKEVDSSKIIIFKYRRQLNKWYYQNFEHKMKI